MLEWVDEAESETPFAYEVAPGLPSSVLALFAEDANSEVTVETAYAPLSMRTSL